MAEKNIVEYDSNEVNVIVGGRYITGMAEGTFVEGSKDENNVNATVGAKGDIGISKVNNTLGTITLTLQQTSPDIGYLDSLANKRSIVPIQVIAPNEKFGGTKAMVLKPSDASFSDEIEDREYEIQVFDYTKS
jgi:hypothetical protein